MPPSVPIRPLFRALAALAAAGLFGAMPAAVAGESWPRWLRDGRYTDLTRELVAVQQRFRRGELDDRQHGRALASLSRAPAGLAPKFGEWVNATEQRGVALMARGLFWANQGWQARGTAYARDTSDEQFARMNQRFSRAAADLKQALSLLDRCPLCYSTLIDIARARGARAEQARLFHEGIAQHPDSIRIPTSYFAGLQRKWGGYPGDMERFVRVLAHGFPSSPALPVLEAELIIQEANIHYHARRYEQALPIYAEGLAMDPERPYTLEKYAYALARTDRRTEALAAIERSLALDPWRRSAFARRARLLLEFDRPREALPDVVRAVELGDRWALQAALYVWGRGAYGEARDDAKTWELCETAIRADNPEGYDCKGSHYYRGRHVQRDAREAAKWFRRAAVHGVARAMVDLGVILWNGDGVERDERRAVEYWREARRLGEARAETELRGHLSAWRYFREVRLPDWWERAGAKTAAAAEFLVALFRALVGAYMRGRYV